MLFTDGMNSKSLKYRGQRAMSPDIIFRMEGGYVQSKNGFGK